MIKRGGQLGPTRSGSAVEGAGRRFITDLRRPEPNAGWRTRKLRYTVSSPTIAHGGSFICRDSDAKSHPATRLPTRIICRQINPPLDPLPPPSPNDLADNYCRSLDQWCETGMSPESFLFKLRVDISNGRKQKINVDMLTQIYGND